MEYQKEYKYPYATYIYKYINSGLVDDTCLIYICKKGFLMNILDKNTNRRKMVLLELISITGL